MKPSNTEPIINYTINQINTTTYNTKTVIALKLLKTMLNSCDGRKLEPTSCIQYYSVSIKLTRWRKSVLLRQIMSNAIYTHGKASNDQVKCKKIINLTLSEKLNFPWHLGHQHIWGDNKIVSNNCVHNNWNVSGKIACTDNTKLHRTLNVIRTSKQWLKLELDT